MPVYLVVLGLYFLVPPFKEWEALPPLWKFLTFTQNLGLNRLTHGTFSHAWSLCIEEQFYLLFPIIIAFAIYSHNGKKAFLLLPLLFVAGFILRFSIWVKIIQPLEGTDSFYSTWMTWMYYPTFTRLDGLIVGVGIAAVFEFLPNTKLKITRYGNLLLLLGLVLIVAASFVCDGFGGFSTSIVGFPMIAIAYGVLLMGAVSPNTFLFKHGSRITSFIAALSYSIYLSHKGIIHLTQEYFSKLGIEEDGNWMIVPCFINCILAAWILHVLVEKPFLRWRDNFLKKRKAAF